MEAPFIDTLMLSSFGLQQKENAMTVSNPTSTSPPRAKRGIGAVTSRKREELQQFKAARKRSIEKLNQELAQLAQAVAEAEARERRQARNQQMADQKRLKFVLGGLVLTALRELGQDAFAMTPEDLRQLQDKDRQLLIEVLAASTASGTEGCGLDSAAPPTGTEVDLPL